MTTYICKCGRTFQKNTEAGTTGFRLPDYGPEHECFGCPFIQKEQWREGGRDLEVNACRGSKVLDYQTDAYSCESKGAALHVRTLDLKFIQEFYKDYLTLAGHTNKHLFHGMDSPDNGRWQYSFGFAANKQGDADRKALIDRYFKLGVKRPGEALPCGADHLIRRDVTPEQEKEIVLSQIKEAKALAQGKTAPTGTAYVHGNFRYFVDQRDDNGKFTAFMSSPSLGEGVRSEVPTIPDFDTFNKAQNALDGFALKKGYAAEGSTPDNNPKVEQAEEMNEAAGRDDIPQTDQDADQNDLPADQSGPSADENSDSPEDPGNSESDTPEEPQKPCDWKNASGRDDDDDEDEEPEKPDQSLPDGPDLSLRLPAFDAIFNAADDALRDMARTLKTKFIESGELDLKIVIDNMGGILRPNCKSSKGYCQLKPAKVTFPIRFSDDVEFTVDAQGRVILPEDREHQINFDEIQPGQRNIPPSGTATVDGSTGIVEDYKEDGVGDQTPYEDQGEQTEEKLYPCKNTNCPFYAFDAEDPDDYGCCFNPAEDADDGFDIAEAVEQNSCTRPEVIDAYAADHPPEETDFEGSGETQDDDFPEFKDEEMGQDAS